MLKVDGETLEEALNTVNAHRETLAPLTDFPLGSHQHLLATLGHATPTCDCYWLADDHCVCVSPEAPCLVAYSDGLYYRAEVLGFAGLNPLEVLVRHVDYGSDDTLPINKYCCPCTPLACHIYRLVSPSL